MINNGQVDTILQDNLTENPNSKVAIGTPISTHGILV